MQTFAIHLKSLQVFSIPAKQFNFKTKQKRFFQAKNIEKTHSETTQ